MERPRDATLSRDALVADGADVRGDASLDAGAPGRTCVASGASSTVAGQTPLGVVQLPFAWAGYLGGECGEQIFLVLVSEAHFIQSDPPQPLLQTSSFSAPWEGVHEVDVHLDDGDQRADATALVVVHAAGDWFDPDARLEATITVAGGGWGLEGDVTARWCAPLIVQCP